MNRNPFDTSGPSVFSKDHAFNGANVRRSKGSKIILDEKGRRTIDLRPRRLHFFAKANVPNSTT